MFDAPVDGLLKSEAGWPPAPDREEPRPQAKGRHLPTVLGILLALCALCAGYFAFRWQSAWAQADAGAQAGLQAQPPDLEELRRYYFDFARTFRLDYVPFFQQGEAPTESPEYLLFAYAVNLDGWGEDKGVMTKTYVDETVLSYFGVSGLSHLPMRKGWDYDGAVYTAYPEGLRQPPIYVLSDYATWQQEGRQYHRITVDYCAPSGGMIPEEDQVGQLREQAAQGDMTGLTVLRRESFLYSVSAQNFDRPVFAAHTLEEENP